jgi:hypothetical protein
MGNKESNTKSRKVAFPACQGNRLMRRCCIPASLAAYCHTAKHRRGPHSTSRPTQRATHRQNDHQLHQLISRRPWGLLKPQLHHLKALVMLVIGKLQLNIMLTEPRCPDATKVHVTSRPRFGCDSRAHILQLDRGQLKGFQLGRTS